MIFSMTTGPGDGYDYDRPRIPPGAAVPAARHHPVLVTTRPSVLRVGHSGWYSWTVNGIAHREDGPASVNSTGEVIEYRQHGKLHRDGGPARIKKGSQEWYQHGRRARPDGGPTLTLPNGSMRWLDSDAPETGWHRENGPADLDANGQPSWWLNGLPRDRDTVLDAWLQTHHPDTPSQTRALMELLADDWRPETTFDDLHAAATAALRE